MSDGGSVESAPVYRRILKRYPDHFDALHRLGVSEKQLGNHEAAMRLIKRALLANPRGVLQAERSTLTKAFPERVNRAPVLLDRLKTASP